MTIKYAEDIYPKEVLIKAAYRFLDRAYIHIDKQEGSFFVSITPKERATELTKGEFDNEMLAQAARYVVSAKTKNIRELTLARAMASTVIEDKYVMEEFETDEIDFNPDVILRDWFDNEK